MGIVSVPSFGADPVTVTGPSLDAKVDGLATEFNGHIDEDNLDPSISIPYANLDLTGKIVNGDIVSLAASKLTGVVATTSLTITTAPADVSASGLKITLNANEAQAFGDICRIDSDGQAHIAKADALATSGALVMAIATINANADGEYLLLGTCRNDAGWNWTVGGLVYLTSNGTTGNTLTQTAPVTADSVTQIVGVATHADRMYFNPQLIQLVHT